MLLTIVCRCKLGEVKLLLSVSLSVCVACLCVDNGFFLWFWVVPGLLGWLVCVWYIGVCSFAVCVIRVCYGY